MASVPVSPSKGGVASVSVKKSLSKEIVASLFVCPSEVGVVPATVINSKISILGMKFYSHY